MDDEFKRGNKKFWRGEMEKEIERVRKGTKAIKLKAETNEMENIFHWMYRMIKFNIFKALLTLIKNNKINKAYNQYHE